MYICSDSTEVDVDTVVDHNEHESNQKRAAALFVLKTREEGRLTQRALNQVVLSATSLCEEVVGNMESEVLEALKGIGLPEADQKTVMNRLASVSRDPFEGLTTEYKQEKYYKENFNYLVSIHSNTYNTNYTS